MTDMESMKTAPPLRDEVSVWMGALFLVQPVTYLLSAGAFVGGCILVLTVGLANAFYLGLAFVVGSLAGLLPGVVVYVVMGGIRNSLRVQAAWYWLSWPLYLLALSITLLSGMARLAELFKWADFHFLVGAVSLVLAVAFCIVAFFGGLMGALRQKD